MSNDKTTLADVQPGGRVRLEDALTTRRFIAERTTNPQHRQDVLDGDYDGTEWFAHVQAALSGQPSSGGQGEDARVQFDAWLEANSIDITRWGDGEYTGPAAHNYWRVWQAALAARQPEVK